jgi:uridine kinase
MINFDLPVSIDLERMHTDLLSLKKGEKVQRLEYTFNNPARKPKTLEFRPAPIIVVEGILVFYIKKINDLFNLRIFIDAKEQVKLARRIKRDNEERGYDLDDVLYRYIHHVAPIYEKYIAPLKSEVDIIIPNNTDFMKGFGVLTDHLNAILRNAQSSAFDFR